MAGGVTYYNYGKFTEADETGVITGEFTASEFAFPIIYSRPIDSTFNIGITFKPILSHLEKYTSTGFAFDFGANYVNPSGLFSAGLVVRNIGLQVTKYASEERMKLPFEIDAGITQKLENAPLRFSLTLIHLERYDLISDIEDSDSFYFADSKVLDNILRHTLIGIEMVPTESFYMNVGYNYLLRREMDPEYNVSSVGFCWGFGINTSLINIELAKYFYHIAGASTHVSMIVKLDKLYNQ